MSIIYLIKNQYNFIINPIYIYIYKTLCRIMKQIIT